MFTGSREESLFAYRKCMENPTAQNVAERETRVLKDRLWLSLGIKSSGVGDTAGTQAAPSRSIIDAGGPGPAAAALGGTEQ